MKNPIQPLAKDAHGTLRFKKNAIVDYLLEWSKTRGLGLNELAAMDFTQDDREQFWQLIGYSLGGYGELSFVSDDTYKAAATMADEGLSEKDARIAALEQELFMVRSALREPVARLYGIHPDDLKVPEHTPAGVPACVCDNGHRPTNPDCPVNTNGPTFGAPEVQPAQPLNGIPATWQHDEGAYAQCGDCGRYSADPASLRIHAFACECGSTSGWCGSFKKPGPDAKWSGTAPGVDLPDGAKNG